VKSCWRADGEEKVSTSQRPLADFSWHDNTTGEILMRQTADDKTAREKLEASDRSSPSALPYQTIALICVILVIVEVIGWYTVDAVKIAVLLGVAILALLAPNIESLNIGKEGLVANLRKQLERNTEKIQDTKNAAREIDEQLNQKMTQLFEELKTLGGRLAGPSDAGGSQRNILAQKMKSLPPPKVANDPQKGRFGGQEAAGGRRLSAIVEPSSVDSNWCKITLVVSAEPGAPPLSGKISFYLHDSFEPDHYIVPTGKEGNATLHLRAWGAFTVGAVADEGTTLLELDLATSPNVKAPDDWRRR
jgi:prokaryotic YEATS domain